MQITFSQSSEVSWSRLLLQAGYAIAIALLFVVLVVAVAGQINPAPTGDSPFGFGLPQTQELCEGQDATWIKDAPIDGPGNVPAGYCSGPTRIEKEWTTKTDAHTQTVRLSLVAGGVVTLLAGLVFLSHRTMAASLILSAIVALHKLAAFDVPTLAVADKTHVVLLGLAWIILLYLGRILFPRTE